MNATLTQLQAAFTAFDNNSRTRTFNKLAQQFLDKNFNARGIFATHGISFYKFMQSCFEDGGKYSLITLYGELSCVQFLDALFQEMKSDDATRLEFANLLTKEDEGGEEVVAEMIAEEVMKTEAPAAVAEEAPKQAPQEVQEVKQAEVQAAPVAAPAPAQNAQIEEVKTEQKRVSANLGFNIDLGAVLQSAAIEYLESDEAGILAYIKERIEKEAAKMNPTLITIGAANPVKLNDRLHKSFNEALEICVEEKQAFLSGPAGTGKTTLCSQLAKALQVPFGHISCTAGMSEAHLMGRMIADGSYVPSEFIELYENGGVFLFDEVDAADPNTLLIINSALANGYMSVPNRKDNPRAKRHNDFYAVCSANTWGSGSSEYAGRQQMDAAFMDRFAVAKVAVDYDVKLEKEIIKGFEKFGEQLHSIRENLTKNRVRRILSTRVFVSSAKQLAAGKTEKQVLDRFFTGWSPEEVKKALGTN